MWPPRLADVDSSKWFLRQIIFPSKGLYPSFPSFFFFFWFNSFAPFFSSLFCFSLDHALDVSRPLSICRDVSLQNARATGQLLFGRRTIGSQDRLPPGPKRSPGHWGRAVQILYWGKNTDHALTKYLINTVRQSLAHTPLSRPRGVR